MSFVIVGIISVGWTISFILLLVLLETQVLISPADLTGFVASICRIYDKNVFWIVLLKSASILKGLSIHKEFEIFN
jgi:putative flippase GtrA